MLPLAPRWFEPRTAPRRPTAMIRTLSLLLATLFACAIAPARATDEHDYAKGEYAVIRDGLAPDKTRSLSSHGDAPVRPSARHGNCHGRRAHPISGPSLFRDVTSRDPSRDDDMRRSVPTFEWKGTRRFLLREDRLFVTSDRG